MTKTLSYLKAVVICHGKSEKQMCDFIKSNLRIRIAVESDKKGDARKQEYIKIFPTDPKYQRREVIQVKEFGDNLRKNPDTNMEEFIDFCLNLKNTNS